MEISSGFIVELMHLGLLLAGVTGVTLELITGYAVVGFRGRVLLAQRKKLPGPFWFAFLIHVALGIVVPSLMYFGR